MIRYILIFIMITLSVGLNAQKFQKLASLYGNWKFSIGDDKAWAKEDYKDADWESIKVPSNWEDQGFNGYDGFAWYRKRFTISSDFKNEQLYLELGYIDDCDEVYVNGTLIGYTGSMPPKYSTAYDAFRRYILPREILRYDKPNTIAVRVYDSGIAGGIVNGNVGLTMQENPFPLIINLEGLWKFIPRDNMEYKNPGVAGVNWKSISVPKAWEDQGYKNYDGFGWYCKNFSVTSDYSKENLVLVLGKIDDFEEVYLNGQYIGPLKRIDEVRKGGTKYAQFRAYFIPGKLLKPGNNVLSVRVLDIGGWGGIYEGPVGFSKQSDYVRFWRNGGW